MFKVSEFTMKWYTVKPVLVATSVKQATCIKQHVFITHKKSNAL